MHIIWKTVKINNRNRRYWSDDDGLSWYWIGSRRPYDYASQQWLYYSTPRK